LVINQTTEWHVKTEAKAEGLTLKFQKTATSSTVPKTTGTDTIVNGEVLVKTALSQELQMYHSKITESILSTSKELSQLAFESLSKDPGIQPLLPYFVELITVKVLFSLSF
jgi:transcription initiation factor TFIID subunit 6